MNYKKYFEKFSPYLYLIPALTLMAVFMYLPLIKSIQYSLFRFKNFLPYKFVGLDNYVDLFQDGLFWNSIYLTGKWVLMTALLPGFFGLILALLVEYNTKGRIMAGLTRTVLFMPMMMSLVAVGLMWSLIYNPMLGLINGIIHTLGMAAEGNYIDLFSHPGTEIYVAFIPIIWQGAGFAMVIFSAAMQSIPKDILEASVIDGANKPKQIAYIILPSIFRTITTVITVNMISGFKAFDMLYVLTAGGPSSSTEITSLYMYRLAFFSFKFDYASAVSVILLVAVLICVFLVGKVTDRLNSHFGQ